MDKHRIHKDLINIKNATYYEDVKSYIKVGVEKYINAYKSSEQNPTQFEQLEAFGIWKSLFTTAGSHLYPNWKAIKKEFREKHQEFILAVERKKRMDKSEDKRKKIAAIEAEKRKKLVAAKKKK